MQREAAKCSWCSNIKYVHYCSACGMCDKQSPSVHLPFLGVWSKQATEACRSRAMMQAMCGPRHARSHTIISRTHLTFGGLSIVGGGEGGAEQHSRSQSGIVAQQEDAHMVQMSIHYAMLHARATAACQLHCKKLRNQHRSAWRPCCLHSLHVVRSALTLPPGGLQEALSTFRHQHAVYTIAS